MREILHNILLFLALTKPRGMLCPNGTVKPFLVSLVEPVAYLNLSYKEIAACGTYMGNAEGSLFGFDSYVQIAACGTYRCRSQPLAPFSDGSRVALHVVGMLLAVVLPVGGARSVLFLLQRI